MMNLSIGLSGIDVAQRALELIGTNIANASTEGYHRQDLQISPMDFNNAGLRSSGGAQVVGVRRTVDLLLEQEVYRQETGLGQANNVLATLEMIETALGDIGSGNLSQSIQEFFLSLSELSADPSSTALRGQAIWSADQMASQFRSLSQFLGDIEQHLLIKSQDMAGQANSLLTQISELNQETMDVVNRGGTGNLLKDRRDEAIRQLSQIIPIRLEGVMDPTGQVTVVAWGATLVLGSRAAGLEVGQTDGTQLGVGVVGADSLDASARGGSLGAMLELKNQVIPGIRGQLDALATQIMNSVNALHVQGVGTAGSFTQLAGAVSHSGAVSEFVPPVRDGQLSIRVIDDATGDWTRHTIDIAATDTLAAVAAKIDALAGLDAGVESGCLAIRGAAGYSFDFLPTLAVEPANPDITGTSTISISGTYGGSSNQMFSFKVNGSGQVGADSDLKLEVTDELGAVVANVNIGQGYVPGDRIRLANGIEVAISAGTLGQDSNFGVQALAVTDTSGLLAAAGINTLFGGRSAGDMVVRGDVLASPGLLATGMSSLGGDSENIKRMASLGSARQASLDQSTPLDYFNKLVSGLGQMVHAQQSRRDGLQSVLNQLAQQRNEMSGVDMNEEAAKLMMFERMYQGMARFITAENQVMKYLIDLI